MFLPVAHIPSFTGLSRVGGGPKYDGNLIVSGLVLIPPRRRYFGFKLLSNPLWSTVMQWRGCKQFLAGGWPKYDRRLITRGVLRSRHAEQISSASSFPTAPVRRGRSFEKNVLKNSSICVISLLSTRRVFACGTRPLIHASFPGGRGAQT